MISDSGWSGLLVNIEFFCAHSTVVGHWPEFHKPVNFKSQNFPPSIFIAENGRTPDICKLLELRNIDTSILILIWLLFNTVLAMLG